MDLRPMLAQLYGATDDPDSLLTRLVNDTAETLASAHVSVSWGDRLLTLDFEAPDHIGFLYVDLNSPRRKSRTTSCADGATKSSSCQRGRVSSSKDS